MNNEIKSKIKMESAWYEMVGILLAGSALSLLFGSSLLGIALMYVPAVLAVAEAGRGGLRGSRHDKNPSEGSKVLAVMITFILAFLIVGSASAIHNNLKEAPRDQLHTSVSSDKFTDDRYGFSIVFPGKPQTQHTNESTSGVDIPVSIHQYSGPVSTYAISIAEYSKAFDVNGRERRILNGVINGPITEKIKLTEHSNSGKFMGYPSADAIYTDSGKKEFEGLMITKHFLINGNLYTIMAIDSTKDEFDEFAGTFNIE